MRPLHQWPDCAIELLRRVSVGLFNPSAEIEPSLCTCCQAHLHQLNELQIDSLYYLVCDPTSPVQRVYDRVFQVQYQTTQELLRTLANHGVSPIIFKGAEHLVRYFGAHSLALLADVDLLVDRTELAVCRIVLYSSGYRQAKVNFATGQLDEADFIGIAQVEEQHYELFPFRRIEPVNLDPEERVAVMAWQRHPLLLSDKGAFVIMEFDVHFKVALDIETPPLLERSRPSAFCLGRSLSPADHLWFTTARLYKEVGIHGKRSLRDFAYALAIMANEDIDWSIVLAAADEYELRPSLFYYLSFMSALSQRPAPPEVLTLLSPDRGARKRDWGWQISKLFGLVDPRPALW